MAFLSDITACLMFLTFVKKTKSFKIESTIIYLLGVSFVIFLFLSSTVILSY